MFRLDLSLTVMMIMMIVMGQLPLLSLAFHYSYSVPSLWKRPFRSILPILPILPKHSIFMVPTTREFVETETDRRTKDRRTKESNQEKKSSTTSTNNKDGRQDGPLEYLQDPNESRNSDDPFHILLLGETFDKPKITLNYVTGNLQYALAMPYDEAIDASMVAQDFGMSCLGTWSREECLILGKALQVRDLCVRVVPYAAGGNRSWQSKPKGDSQENEQETFWKSLNGNRKSGSSWD